MNLAIQLPPVRTDNYVDVDLTVNGRKQRFKYRVEIFKWEEWCSPTEPKAEGIRRMINAHDPGWQLVEIGSPTETTVPLMFRLKKNAQGPGLYQNQETE